jgi:hypothetical protein
MLASETPGHAGGTPDREHPGALPEAGRSTVSLLASRPRRPNAFAAGRDHRGAAIAVTIDIWMAPFSSRDGGGDMANANLPAFISGRGDRVGGGVTPPPPTTRSPRWARARPDTSLLGIRAQKDGGERLPALRRVR